VTCRIRLPDRACRLGHSGLLSGQVACQVEPLEPPPVGQALLCGSRSRGGVAPGV
jgi:hypothetical protein